VQNDPQDVSAKTTGEDGSWQQEASKQQRNIRGRRRCLRCGQSRDLIKRA